VFGENAGVLARIVALVLPLGLDDLALAIVLGLTVSAHCGQRRVPSTWQLFDSGTFVFPIRAPVTPGCWEPVNRRIMRRCACWSDQDMNVFSLCSIGTNARLLRRQEETVSS
jgi:hypothetical protein